MALLCVPIVLVVFLFSQTLSASGSEGLQPVVDLQQDGALSQRENRVVLLEFSAEYCEYCELLESEFLIPMTKNAEYDKKVIIRSAMLYEGRRIIGFDGTPTSVDVLAERYDVSLTPTLVFVDSQGNQLSEPLVGIWSIDFYGGYLDARIDQARARLLESL
ncbi:MAG: thioredoxin fold domain-containing protein [Pseudomonadota bacterium]